MLSCMILCDVLYAVNVVRYRTEEHNLLNWSLEISAGKFI